VIGLPRLERGDDPTFGLTVEFQTFTDQPLRAILVGSVVDWDGTERVQTSVFPIRETDADSGQLLSEQAMDQAPIGITVSDPSQPDNPLIQVNDGFCTLTGYDREEFLGRNCRFLQGEATREETVAGDGSSDRGPRACHCRFAKLPQRRLDVLESSHDYPDPG